ncbi:histidine--tRNA ligase [Candidatus Kaiserbacteria bacterium]|nr:histidine--tRNA ligase [Candidatus Kaiserbacteria bacterium]
MADKKLSTDPYKGVRDFYPEDMAIQRYIFDTWSHTAESFGYERYDASVLEPAELYRSKTSEEIVNEQTYTFTDRGDREVTLRPEMTPTVARMVAGKRRELSFPVRWYSIPNLFRYERMQRGRLREHWQLNCDLFGVDDYTADVEMIALAYQTFINFGADPEMFAIRVNNRGFMEALFKEFDVTDVDTVAVLTRLIDRKDKMPADDFREALDDMIAPSRVEEFLKTIEGRDESILDTIGTDTTLKQVLSGLRELGIENAFFSPSLARGFDYYTGTIFEFFDVSEENNRSLLGGGRYDNLTGLFGGDPISGVGFGMGDVTMRDFLETHDLLIAPITSPTLMILPTDESFNFEAQRLAQQFRAEGISVSVDATTKKIGKKVASADKALVSAVIVLGEDELKSGTYTMKNLPEGTEEAGTVEELLGKIIT